MVLLLLPAAMSVYKPRGMTRYGWRRRQQERERNRPETATATACDRSRVGSPETIRHRVRSPPHEGLA